PLPAPPKPSAFPYTTLFRSKIDPPGFALESFDVMGHWRDRYRGISNRVLPEQGFGKNGWPFTFHYAQAVDSSGKLPDGRAFDGIDRKSTRLNSSHQIISYAV